MWECPKCGRTFERKNQNHFCPSAVNSVIEYIEGQPENVRDILYKVRKTILEVLPDVKEKISWKMPTYWKEHNIIHFAAFKNHLGVYPGPEAIIYFADKLEKYRFTKGAVQFQYNEPIPYELIAEIARWCYDTGSHH